MIPTVVGTAGYVIEGVDDDELALKTVKADFPLSSVDAWCQIDNGMYVPVPGSRVVLAGTTPLGTVGKRWHPVQNSELLSMSRSYARAVGSKVAVGGVTPDRRRTWFWIPLDTGFSSVVSTAHDGRGSVSVQLVVDDGHSVARNGNRDKWLTSFPHGPTLSTRFEDPTGLAEWTTGWLAGAREEVENLAISPAGEQDFTRLAGIVFPVGANRTDRKEKTRRESLDRVASRWIDTSTARGTRMNRLDLVFSFCWYLDHGRDGRPAYLAEQALEDSNWVARAKTALWEMA